VRISFEKAAPLREAASVGHGSDFDSSVPFPRNASFLVKMLEVLFDLL